ncbi:hypothetical protein [Marinobacter salexigens]|uniref:hypothetical protein n=1 Tax=Marinobacter salexigens TaxID=1925763 RepID=UPI0013747E57|nr:hypothetical protein [Marinobacter salexigens]
MAAWQLALLFSALVIEVKIMSKGQDKKKDTKKKPLLTAKEKKAAKKSKKNETNVLGS